VRTSPAARRPAAADAGELLAPGPLSVVVAGGGTAGHVEPALALADAVRRLRPDAVVTALGTATGLEARLVPARGYALAEIPACRCPRRPTLDLLRLPGRVAGAVRQTRAHLDRVQADVVVGFGGYVALPAYLAGRRRGTPLVVHEANARAGLANRVGARMTRHVAAAVEGSGLRGAQVLGIPLRPQIETLDRAAARAEARRSFGLPEDRHRAAGHRRVAGRATAQHRRHRRRGRPRRRRGARAARRRAEAGRRGQRRAGDRPAEEPSRAGLRRPHGPRLRRRRPRRLPGRRDDLRRARRRRAAGGLRAAADRQRRAGPERPPVVEAGGGVLVDDADFDAARVRSEVLPLLTDPDRLGS
jgi:UDP-N-acetylglucosamine--N-acetylmuramyl-(pentapeptide) pyrophosphoryl-undecaprenol N-acetylglucosamine transferase